jgi:hypothetical protein
MDNDQCDFIIDTYDNDLTHFREWPFPFTHLDMMNRASWDRNVWR